jgi:hypothetical protein
MIPPRRNSVGATPTPAANSGKGSICRPVRRCFEIAWIRLSLQANGPAKWVREFLRTHELEPVATNPLKALPSLGGLKFAEFRNRAVTLSYAN